MKLLKNLFPGKNYHQNYVPVNGFCLILLLSLLLHSCSNQTKEKMEIAELDCQYCINPLGIDSQNPDLSWILKSSGRDQKQTAYQILVAEDSLNLAKDTADTWNSGKINSDASIHIKYEGKSLQSGKRYWWKVKIWDKDGIASDWSKAAYWETGLLKPEDWKADWIGLNTDAAPILRKEFKIEKEIAQARVYISGLGYYELSLNGVKVGDHVLDPGQTDYEQRVFYVSYDITPEIKKGVNAIGIMLGNGWYNQTVVNTKRFGWGDVIYGKPRVIAQIQLKYSDGTQQITATDKSWKGSTGAILSDNIYLGESYDAGLEKPGWNKPGYDDKSWNEVLLMQSPGGKLQSQMLQPIKKIKTVDPVKIANPKPRVYVYDMGQNFAGWVKLKLKAGKGTKIQLRFAETVFEDGMIDPASTGVYATNTVQTDQYTCKGEGVEEWEPRFTYHGFQYVEMTGFPGTPTLDNLQGIVVNTALEENGTFECSDKMINRIHNTILWTTLSNVHSILTDCPHRERCQWLGDILAEMSVYNFNAPRLLTKFVDDIETGRRGDVPNHISPGRRTGGKASSDWGSTFIQIPYYMYLYYNDISVARNHYEGMSFFMDYLQKISKDYIIYEGWGDLFEPGSVKSKRTPNELTSTAFFYYDACLMHEMAKVLDKKEDIQKYSSLAENIGKAFVTKYYHPENKTFGSQTADAIALNFSLVPKGDEAAVAENLKKDVVDKFNGHHSTGHMGTRYIYGELSRFGYGEVAQKMLNQTTYPSFGELFARGATTIWEYWGEKVIDETSAGTRSRNHPFQGGFDVWFYNGIAGINPDPQNPGFKHIIMKPQVFGTLTSAKASFKSPYGLICSDWKKNNNSLQWDFSIPVNTTADIYVPAEKKDDITENGSIPEKSSDIKYLRKEGTCFVYQLGSGDYKFRVGPVR